MFKTNTKLTLFIITLYLFRLWFCYEGYLKNYMWLDVGDESHIYLIGLRFYTTGQFPLWGPDIVYTSTYLVGGMQGLLVGLPLFVWHHPFAPYFFLYLVLSVELIYLSWYITKLFSNIPEWLIYLLIATVPVSIHTGLKIINPAYVLCFSIPFMLSLIEEFKIFKKQYIKRQWRFFWLGIAVTAIFQLHASWIVVFILFAITWLQMVVKEKKIKSIVILSAFQLTGLLVGFITLIPVIYTYGLSVLLMQSKNIAFSWRNFSDYGNVLFYFITLSGYEMGSFSNVYCFEPLMKSFSFTAALVFGILQVIGLLFFILQIVILFLKKGRSEVRKNKFFLYLVSFIILGVASLYLFSFVRPGTHAIICLFPLSAIYLIWSLNLLSSIIKNHFLNKIVACFAGLLMVYYCIIVINTNSFLPHLGYREKAFKAIAQKNESIFEIPRYPYPLIK